MPGLSPGMTRSAGGTWARSQLSPSDLIRGSIRPFAGTLPETSETATAMDTRVKPEYDEWCWEGGEPHIWCPIVLPAHAR